MCVTLFISLLLLGTSVQSTQDSVSAQRVQEIESRIEELESTVNRHEIAEGYFDSMMTSERTMWVALLTIVLSAVGGFTYYKFHQRVKSITNSFEETKEKLDDMESEFYTTQAMVYKNYSVRNRKQNSIKAFRDQIDAAISLVKSGEITDVDKRTLEEDLKDAVQSLVNARIDGYTVSRGFYLRYDQKISKIGDFFGKDFEEVMVRLSKEFSKIEINEQ